jgi:sucrose synthase
MNKPFDTGSANVDDIRIVDIIRADCLPVIKRFYLELKSTEQSFYLMDQIRDLLDDFLDREESADTSQKAAIVKLFRGCQEVIIFAECMYALLRPKIGVKRVVRLHPEREQFDEVSRGHYLEVKDAYVQGWGAAGHPGLVLNFSPYFTNFPKIKEPSEMGEGLSFLNRQLSGQMYRDTDVFRRALVRFLQDCQLDGINLLANGHLNSPETLSDELDAARSMLADMPRDKPYSDFAHELRTHGFEAGWGGSAGEIAENLALLSRVFQSPDPGRFETFLGRLPLVKSIVMVSPHGYFAQEGVLGRPDTGGQVTYVLDQARALERRMRHMFEANGIDIQPRIVILTRLIPESEGTTCNVPREKVHGSENTWILRVPFRDTAGEIIPHWISRFQIWPYLETFAEEAKNLVVTELLGKPDLVVGHYSDGNLVAYMLAEALEVTHCAAVHALEKTKYLFSDMRWAEMEESYRFSLHFSADIIAYNSADYIITSSYREIAGTQDEMGMFESYETFSMPGLYRVLSGMDPQLARYNIVPPGASEEYFFPHTDKQRRVPSVTENLEELLFGNGGHPDVAGHFDDPARPPIFAMSRLDKVKNLAGFVELFGKSDSLREVSNLIILSSIIDASQSKDQ